MTEAAHPYPDAEHYVFPTNAVEAMADNRRLYGGERDAMLLFTGRCIPGLYGQQPLYEYFVQVSRLLYVNQLMEGEVEAPVGDRAPTSIDNGFHAGSLIGMDARLSTMRPHRLARDIMAHNPLEKFKRDDLSEEDKAHFGKEMELLKQFHSRLWKSMVKEMGAPARQELVMTARAVCGAAPESEQLRQETIAGIVFAQLTIERTKLRLRAEN
ncbi:MAG TPA: hypothetical protein VGE30_00410 [Candidatus Saccharimonadales bacterium]